jgi:Fe-S oxidoreductase
MSRHHLIPRTRHHNKKTKKTFQHSQLDETVNICRACHRQVHALFSEKTLERLYNHIETITSHPEIAKFIDWIKDKPAHCVPIAKRSW